MSEKQNTPYEPWLHCDNKCLRAGSCLAMFNVCRYPVESTPPVKYFVADQFPLERVVMNGMMGGSDPI